MKMNNPEIATRNSGGQNQQGTIMQFLEGIHLTGPDIQITVEAGFRDLHRFNDEGLVVET